MEQRWQYLKDELQSEKLDWLERDFGQYYQDTFSGASLNTVGSMLLSPCVEHMDAEVQAEFIPNSGYRAEKYLGEGVVRPNLFVDVKEVRIHPVIHNAIKDLPLWQFQGRHKLFSGAWGPARLNELTKRVWKFEQNRDMAKEFRATNAQSDEIARNIYQITLKHIHPTQESVALFLKTHDDRSLVGRRGDMGSMYWGTLDWVHSWKQTMEIASLTKEFLVEAERNPGFSFNTAYDTGIRSRMSIPLNGFHVLNRFSASGNEPVARIVFFKAKNSLPSMMIDDHASWYKDIMTYLVDEHYQFPIPVTTPVVDGSNTYQIVADLMREGCQLANYDGSGWDGYSAFLAGRGFESQYTTVFGCKQNTSGNFITPVINVVGMLQFWNSEKGRKILREMSCKRVSILSDDWNAIVPRKAKLWPGFKNFIEFADVDYKLQYMFGYGFKSVQDKEKIDGRERDPVLCGIHCQSEAVEHRVNVQLDPARHGIYSKTTSHSERERTILAELYRFGNFNGKAGYKYIDTKSFSMYFSPRRAAVNAVMGSVVV